ncbi:MAG: hypothetical protein LQ350_007101 [Teloschistes chrysophthalmus]|nr:MAG: hypothetical protein LQ350_007101 [Niorma chrysophthalma]
MTSSGSDDPPYASASPVGYHITQLRPFLQSPHRVEASTNPVRRQWATPEGANRLPVAFPPTPSAIESRNLMIYNKSRDTDRICPSCRRWYKVGESEQRYDSFAEFLHRKPPVTATMAAEQKQEQDLSGICSQGCMDTMMDDPSEAAGNSGKELQRSGSWVKRRTTIAEEAAAGVTIMWKDRSTG